MKKIYFPFIALLLNASVQAQLIVDSSQNPTQVIEDVFLSNGVFVSNITYSGGNAQIGTFSSINSNLGLNTGIVMSSGSAAGAIGPNNAGGYTGESLGNWEEVTDTDIIDLNPGYAYYEAAIIEFDFIATGDSLDFQFVFGSEEYAEWTGSAFNDQFGFFLSGPGIYGPYSNGAVNIAAIPGTNLAVSINNLNNGYYNDGPCMNCEYYIDNGDGIVEPNYSDPFYIQYDGFTTVMHASIGQLQIGEVYHIKLAVADAGDSILDTGVFLSGESFVQLCTELVEFMPDACLVSQLGAHVNYTANCGTVEFWNDSEINIEYTNAYYDISDGSTVPALGFAQHTFTEAGTYQVTLVYEVGQFKSKFKLDPITISTAAPEVPAISANGSFLSITNWDGTSQIQWYYNDEPIDGANGPQLDATQSGYYSVSVNNGCPAHSEYVHIVVGITESANQTLAIYPNPTNGLLNLRSAEPARAMIYEATGRLLYDVQFTGTHTLELPCSGVYVIRSYTAGLNCTHRVVVE